MDDLGIFSVQLACRQHDRDHDENLIEGHLISTNRSMETGMADDVKERKGKRTPCCGIGCTEPLL
eukprot:scaffold9176_cov129-Cylindrotheca_fusiformis.AAC.2